LTLFIKVRTTMQTRNPILDEFAKAMETAMSLAQTAGEEAKAALRAQGDRMAAELDLVRRDELEAVRDALTAEIASLRAEVARLTAASTGAVPPSQDAG
jgi:BMFP domain-containing protein YqiC